MTHLAIELLRAVCYGLSDLATRVGNALAPAPDPVAQLEAELCELDAAATPADGEAW